MLHEFPNKHVLKAFVFRKNNLMIGIKDREIQMKAKSCYRLITLCNPLHKGAETINTLTRVRITTNVLEIYDPANVEKTINGSVPVAKSLEGNPMCNDHDRALNDTFTNAKVMVLWQTNDANQHLKLGSNECTLHLQLQHFWNVTSSRKARGFPHNAKEWQAKNSLEGGGLDHATTNLGSSSMSRHHGD